METKDGYSNNATIVSSEISSGDSWICEITPNDGQVGSDGVPLNSSQLNVNNLPGAQNVIITSDDSLNRTSANLTGTFDYYDADADSQTANETKWYKNGVEQTSLANLTWVASGNTSRGEAWTFSARVHDGKEWGNWVNSSIFIVLNTVPTHTEPLLISTNPATNGTDQNLTCYNQSTFDEDGDAVTNIYNWYKNGDSIMVLNLPFETNSPTIAKDYSGYGNNGTVNGATWTSSGKVGGAYQFDGANDYINAGNNPSLNISREITLMAWVKSNANGYVIVKEDTSCNIL